ncbi:hypothetical protein DL769_006132 [Monosporascus sp. CRB-8-3]|nr:hypothetical protein DL769_006132 [Monosporascus sp. CRB-8-3]
MNDRAESVNLSNPRSGGGGRCLSVTPQKEAQGSFQRGANDTNINAPIIATPLGNLLLLLLPRRHRHRRSGTRTRSWTCRGWSRARGPLSASTRPSVAPLDGNNFFTRAWPAHDDVASPSGSGEEGVGPRIRDEGPEPPRQVARVGSASAGGGSLLSVLNARIPCPRRRRPRSWWIHIRLPDDHRDALPGAGPVNCL